MRGSHAGDEVMIDVKLVVATRSFLSFLLIYSLIIQHIFISDLVVAIGLHEPRHRDELLQANRGTNGKQMTNH